MATFRGLVQTLQIRNDGWVEVIVQAVHANNTPQILFIKDLDGDIAMAHKRLGQLSLLRDAITRILPVEIDYETDEAQGNLISDVMVHPRPSIAGHTFGLSIQGTVIGISISELGPLSGLYPYTDAPDIAGITLLKDDGTIVVLQLDLQREEALTMHAMLALLQKAHQNRRPVKILTAGDGSRTGNLENNLSSSHETSIDKSSYIIGCEWVTITESMLDYCHAFIESIGQRYESYDSIDPAALSEVRVVYTTAPAQTPEGDISENGSFLPETQVAWVHDDSPLFKLLQKALKKGLQVQLGLLEDHIHEVDVCCHLGSASRPIWVCINQSFMQENCESSCNNTPTIQALSSSSLTEMSLSLCWKGKGYFNEGIWRFKVSTSGRYELKLDGKLPCCAQPVEDCTCEKNDSTVALNHVYLKGMHAVDLTLYNQKITDPFSFLAYRIR